MPNSSKNKRLLLALLLVFFLAGGFFVVWQSNTAKAIECTPPSVKGTTPEGTEACCPANQKPATVDGKIICETLEQFAQRTKKSSWIPDPFETLKNVAKAVIEVPAKTVLFVLNSILYLNLYLLTKIIYLAGLLINYVMGPDFNQMTHRNVVQTGWSITRDLANMFFALVLLLMSFATVLQIETYGLKKLLGRLVIAALLINFSLVFAGVIIDFTQVFTNYFLEAAAGNSDLSTQLMKGLAVHQLYNTGKATEVTYWSTVSAGFGGSAIAVSIELILGIIVLAVAAFSLFAFAFFLIVRLVWLWLLLIFAPLAWVSMIVPGKGGALWNKWWEHFLKWTFFAPIYMFFLYLGLMMVQDRAVTQISISNPNANFISFFYNHPEIILNYIILIIIMLGGLYVAQSFGVQGANGVIKLGKGMVNKTGTFIGKKADQWAAKGAEKEGKGVWARFRRGTSYLSPTAWKAAWKGRQAQKEREAYPVATGARQDTLNRLNRILSLGMEKGEKTDYKERAIRSREMQERKDIISNNADELIGNYENALASKKPLKAAAHLRALSEQGDINQLFSSDLYKNKGYTTDAQGFQNFVNNEMVPVFGQEHAYRLGHDLNRSLESTGQYWAGRSYTGKYNPQTQQTKYIQNSVADAENLSYGAWSRAMHPQQQARTTHRTSYFAEGFDINAGENGEVRISGLTEGGKKRIQTLLRQHARDIVPEVQFNLMCNFASDVKHLNPGLYTELRAHLSEIKGSNPTAYADLKNSVRQMRTGLTTSDWEDVPASQQQGPQRQEQNQTGEYNPSTGGRT